MRVHRAVFLFVVRIFIVQIAQILDDLVLILNLY